MNVLYDVRIWKVVVMTVEKANRISNTPSPRTYTKRKMHEVRKKRRER